MDRRSDGHATPPSEPMLCRSRHGSLVILSRLPASHGFSTKSPNPAA